MHRRRVDARRRVAVVAGAAVAQAEPALLRGVAEDGAPGDEVPEELPGPVDAGWALGVLAGALGVVARDVAARLLRGRRLVGLAVLPDGAVDEVLEPRPLDLVEVPGVALDLRGFQRDALRC